MVMAQHVAKQEKAVVLEKGADRGSRKSQFLRATGRVPGVVYGLKKDVVAVSLPVPETLAVLLSGSHILEVSLDGQVEKMLIQDVQYDYLQKYIEHVDLMRIDPTKKVRVKVALEFRGVPKGTK